MKTKKTGLMIAIPILALSACSSLQPTVTEEEPLQTAGECNQACLETFADRYIDAMVSHEENVLF